MQNQGSKPTVASVVWLSDPSSSQTSVLRGLALFFSDNDRNNVKRHLKGIKGGLFSHHLMRLAWRERWRMSMRGGGEKKVEWSVDEMS